ncbi:YggS family pyridoxal phosphate-dependent enzyme [Bacillus sp. T33-2]|uniref:YggS family pyridoxal phosphate-dependent enzyme n=1 Tax=Bacillus sp. T33-2 TaxID=2054168 RepID=UPI000C781B59|nr:YggS family pyridoxal phosphate-dependent enzyme [Bacillus sp. T33-2]PLR97362.1 YggS family pyridoxal phosphate-dependent enzyme [Bacillus sp. T33-2]
MKVSENLQKINEQIKSACQKAGRNPDEVKIVAVTKYVSAERAAEAVQAGIVHIGENREEGLLEKQGVLKDKPVWHFIGTLQTRKVKNVIDKIDYLHSVDRLSLAKEIDKRAAEKINCFVQVNVSGEESKHGLAPDAVPGFIRELGGFKKINVAGLMTMAPNTNDENVLRQCFRTLKTLQASVQSLGLAYAPCNELSMGMSNDFAIAIEEGATMIRIGTALVGDE